MYKDFNGMQPVTGRVRYRTSSSADKYATRAEEHIDVSLPTRLPTHKYSRAIENLVRVSSERYRAYGEQLTIT